MSCSFHFLAVKKKIETVPKTTSGIRIPCLIQIKWREMQFLIKVKTYNIRMDGASAGRNGKISLTDAALLLISTLDLCTLKSHWDSIFLDKFACVQYIVFWFQQFLLWKKIRRNKMRRKKKKSNSTYNKRRVAKNLRRPKLGQGQNSPHGRQVFCHHLREWVERLIDSASHCHRHTAVIKREKKTIINICDQIVMVGNIIIEDSQSQSGCVFPS
jgi:hypothetical protein